MKKVATYAMYFIVMVAGFKLLAVRYNSTQEYSCTTPTIVVHQGETVDGLVWEYCSGNHNNAVWNILEINHVKDPSSIKPGTILRTH